MSLLCRVLIFSSDDCRQDAMSDVKKAGNSKIKVKAMVNCCCKIIVVRQIYCATLYCTKRYYDKRQKI